MNFAQSWSNTEATLFRDTLEIIFMFILKVRQMPIHVIKRFTRLSRRETPPLILLVCLALSVGCATLGSQQTKPPVTVSEVIQMSKEGIPAETIIEKMRDSETVYRLTGSELAKLHDQGVSDQVIDYMQQTYLRAVRRDQRLEDWDYWTLGPDGFWYGGPYYGWPYGWIVVDRRGHGDGKIRDKGEWHGERGAGGVGEHGARR